MSSETDSADMSVEMDLDATVIDTDAHYIDSLEKLAEYIDEDDPFKQRFSGDYPEPVSIWPSSTGSRTKYGRIFRPVEHYSSFESPDQMSEIMGDLKTDKTILLSQEMLLYGKVHANDGKASVYANACVDFMLDKVVDPDKGVYTMVPAPFHEPDEAAELINRVGDEKGVVGVCLVTDGVEPPLGSERYDPIYEATQRAGLPVVFHAGGASLDQFYVNGYKSMLEVHTLGFLFNNISQLVSVVVQGIPERYPDLDIVFQESGITWIPGLLARLDAEYLKRPSEAPILQKRPSEYVDDFYFGTQPLDEPRDPAHLEQMFDMIGVDSLMYASDYPHWDFDPPTSITRLPFLSDEEKAQILGGNAAEVFGI